MNQTEYRMYWNTKNPENLMRWIRLCNDLKITGYSELEAWFKTTYQAVIIDAEAGTWYAQFPNAETYMEFVLTWQ